MKVKSTDDLLLPLPPPLLLHIPVTLTVQLAIMALPNVGHRPGSLKQQNKSHKHGKHRSKGDIDRANCGKPVGRD